MAEQRRVPAAPIPVFSRSRARHAAPLAAPDRRVSRGDALTAGARLGRRRLLRDDGHGQARPATIDEARRQKVDFGQAAHSAVHRRAAGSPDPASSSFGVCRTCRRRQSTRSRRSPAASCEDGPRDAGRREFYRSPVQPEMGRSHRRAPRCARSPIWLADSLPVWPLPAPGQRKGGVRRDQMGPCWRRSCLRPGRTGRLMRRPQGGSGGRARGDRDDRAGVAWRQACSAYPRHRAEWQLLASVGVPLVTRCAVKVRRIRARCWTNCTTAAPFRRAI